MKLLFSFIPVFIRVKQTRKLLRLC